MGRRRKCVPLFSFHPGTNVVFISADGVFRSNNLGKLWEGAGLPLGFYLIHSIKSSGQIFALSMSGSSLSVHKSTDTGRTWSLSGNTTFQIGQRSSLQDFEIDPHSESIFYIAVFGGGIYKSVDSGTTWQNKSNGLPNLFVGELELSAAGTPNLIYLLLNDGSFYFSQNGAEEWTRSSNGLRLKNGKAIESNPRNQQEIYAGGQAENGKAGLFKSSNEGKSWSSLISLPYDVSRISVDSLDPRNIYVIAGGRPFKSDNSGSSWKNLDVPDRALYAEEIEVHPDSPKHIFLSSRSGFYRSSNGGNTWTAVNQRIDNQKAQEIYLCDSATQTFYYAITGYPEVFRSANLKNWNFLFRSKIDSLDGRTFRVNHLRAHKSNPQIILLTSEADGIAVKSGGVWEFRTSPAISDAIFHPFEPQTLFVAGLSDGVQKTTNLGKTWLPMTDGLPTIENPPAERDILQIAIDPINVNTMYVSNVASVYRSMNGGNKWSKLSHKFDFIRDLEVTRDSTIYLATSGNVYRSINKGQSWKKLQQAPSNVSFIRSNPHNPNELFAGGGPMYLFHSKDRGDNWMPFTTVGLPSDVYIYDFLFDSRDTKKILIGTSRGVFHFVKN